MLRAAADYLGVDPTEIALTDSTTMGLGLLYGGLALQQDQETLLTTTHDHYSTDVSLRLRAERTGATVRRISLYEQLGIISRESLVEKLVEQVRDQTRIVAVTWVHSSTGLKLPIAEMAQALENQCVPGRKGPDHFASTESMHWASKISVSATSGAISLSQGHTSGCSVLEEPDSCGGMNGPGPSPTL